MSQLSERYLQGRGWPEWVEVVDQKGKVISYSPRVINANAESTLPVCIYCNCQLIRGIATKDHFIPKSAGGKGGSNLIPACKRCNTVKGNKIFKDVTEAREYILEQRSRADPRWALKQAEMKEKVAQEVEMRAAYVKELFGG